MNEIRIQLPRPHEGQQKVLNSKARWRVLLCGRRWGKSLISQIIAIQKMLGGQHVAYVTPTHELGRKFFKSVLKYLPSQLIVSDNKTDRSIQLITGGSLTFFSGESLDAFRGLSFHCVIVDEAAHIPQLKDQWGESIRPTLTDFKGDGIIISTPKGKEWFYSMYLKGVNGEPDHESFHFTSYDNPTLPAGEVDAMKQELTELQWREEIMAVPGENADNPFQVDVIQKNIIPTYSQEPTVVVGIDLAKLSDWTVLTSMDARGHVTACDRFRLPYELTMDRIANLPAHITKVVDQTGVGEVVVEQLQLYVPNVMGFKFTGESKPKLLYYLMKEMEQGRVKFTEEYASEMYTFQYSYSPSGHIKFEARPGYTDDRIMSLALAVLYKPQAIATQNWTLYSA